MFKMKKHLLLILIMAAIAGAVYAQSTASQVQLGFISTSCPSGTKWCWVQYSATNPIPASLTVNP